MERETECMRATTKKSQHDTIREHDIFLEFSAHLCGEYQHKALYYFLK